MQSTQTIERTLGADAMFVVHAQWSEGRLCLWAESAALARTGEDPAEHAHPFAARADELVALLEPIIGARAARNIGEIEVKLPASDRVHPSPKLAHHLARDPVAAQGLRRVRVAAAPIDPEQVASVIESLLNAASDEARDAGGPSIELGPGVAYFASTVALARHLLAKERFVPMIAQESNGTMHASWRPWVSDEQTAQRVATLLRGMPPVVRSTVDEFGHEPWPILDDALWRVVDSECRRVLRSESMHETIEGRSLDDPHVAWLTGLLSGQDSVEASVANRQEMIRRIRGWVGGLEERGQSAEWRLCLRMNEPLPEGLSPDLGAPPKSIGWSLSFHLQAVEAPQLLIDAADIWLLPSDTVTVEGRRVDGPQELLLAELGRASRVFRKLEKALSEAEPIDILLETEEAYTFLREMRPLLVEQGVGVIAPAWWETPASRLGARLRVGSEESELGDSGAGPGGLATPQLGLSTLVEYHWEIAVGDTTLTLKEFEQLAAQKSPLVRVGGRWVEIRPEDVENAVRFIRENPGGQMRLGDAMRLAFASDVRKTGLPIVGMETAGWVSMLLGGDMQREGLPMVEQPDGFLGTLRPYQLRGVSWMAFLERFGFGVCLADDMGLGKTIQLLALMLHEREQAARAAAQGATVMPVGPTLLIAPTSVLGNWIHEAKRFAPSLKVLVHHGVERLLGESFADAASGADLIITTYALAHRDREAIETVAWGRVVLDEAQYIKNPTAKQSQAVRNFDAERRIALTGTPVENRLSELWSIMEFLNPGYLGEPAAFRKRFALPIERYRDVHKADQLRGLVQPFILRRLKTDPTVVSDLPEKLESKEYCHLTSEQASLYESCVKRMLGEVERAEGIQRRGLVLSALIRLKQICNHPSQLLKDYEPSAGRPPSVTRSGKAIRLIEQVEEVLAEGEQALIFTQFRQMGTLLQHMLRHEFDRDILFLHGGTPQKQRQGIIDTFQRADGAAPILILSLKAGGVGLNLTAATHVFHYDRWWNPAVENQATDRAYRIGQTRTVVVHKYLVRGTLEERIDQMIEQKTELAENIIGAGERWLTELDTDDLREILQLRTDAIGDEG